jgi:hypothetical protein
MKRTMSVLAVIYLCVIVSLTQEKLQPLNVKLGLWETDWTRTMSGQMPIPDELLSRLTPEQRAKMEERMKARAAQSTKASTHKECLTKEKLDKELAFGDDRKECTRTVITSTSSKAQFRMRCADGDVKSDGTFVVEAVNTENVKGSVNMMASGNGHTMNSSGTFTSKWLGSDCGDVK